jgi:dienelactone hydrolase
LDWGFALWSIDMRACVCILLVLQSISACRGREPGNEAIREAGDSQDEGLVTDVERLTLTDLVSVGALSSATAAQTQLDVFAAFDPPQTTQAPPAATRASLRSVLSAHPVSRAWRDHVPPEPAAIDVVTFDDFDVSIVHLELLPETFVPAVLYRPTTTTGPAPAVLALNGHSDTVSKLDVQRRAIHLVKRGFAVLQLEWYGQGQLDVPGQSHAHLSLHELCGVPSHAAFVWSAIHAVDVLERLPGIDPTRLGAVGLSGGGFQTLWLAALDERIQWANVVAGVAAYRDRAELFSALGDQEQAPTDLYLDVDYIDLVGLVAPRPLLLTYNSDDKWFPAEPCLNTLVDGAAPRYADLGATGRLHAFVSHNPGSHVMRTEAFEALFRFINAERLATDVVSEIAAFVDDDVLSVDALTADLRLDNPTLIDLADTICEGLPRDGALPGPDVLSPWAVSRRRTLSEVLRVPERSLIWPVQRGQTVQGAAVTAYLGDVADMAFSVVLVVPPDAERLVLLLADDGRAGALDRAQAHLDDGDAVAIVSPPHIGDATVGTDAWLTLLMEQAIGRRPLGMQARALLDTGVQLAQETGLPVAIDATGPRTSLLALVAAALEPSLFQEVRVAGALASFRRLLDGETPFHAAPEWLSFGMLEHFEVEQLVAMAAPTAIVVREDHLRVAWANALAIGR